MNNWKKIASSLENYGLSAVLLTSPKNRFYATGFYSASGNALITKNEMYFVTDFRYIEAATASLRDATILLADKDANYNSQINTLLKKFRIEKLGYEENRLSVSAFRTYEKELHAALEPCDSMLNNLRAIKEPWEISRIKTAQEISERVLSGILDIIRPGITEREIAAQIIFRLHKEGIDKTSFPPIVVSGANSSLPHGEPSDKMIEPGDFVTIDFGGIYKGYCSDMTRTVAVKSVTDEMKNIYKIVQNAQTAGIRTARAGVKGSEIDAAARAVIEEAGFGKYFGHSFGHGLGVEVHETPTASPNEKAKMPVGSVLTAEPGIYIPGKFGVRIEDILVLTSSGCENLTHFSKELIIL